MQASVSFLYVHTCMCICMCSRAHTCRYPTGTLLPDGRVLVSGGFSDYCSEFCCGDMCANPSLAIFDPYEYDQGKNPWYVSVCVCICMCMYHTFGPFTHMYTRFNTCTYTCTFIHMCTCTCIHIHMCTYAHLHTLTQNGVATCK